MKVHLGSAQKDKLADLCLGIGQLFFGSTVLPYLLPTLDKPGPTVLLFGLALALTCWACAMWVVKGK